MDEASLFNQPVAAKCDAREVHKAADFHDVDEGEVLIQLAAGALALIMEQVYTEEKL
jgi:hypothetical protein